MYPIDTLNPMNAKVPGPSPSHMESLRDRMDAVLRSFQESGEQLEGCFERICGSSPEVAQTGKASASSNGSLMDLLTDRASALETVAARLCGTAIKFSKIG